jgi:hypothetical protein
MKTPVQRACGKGNGGNSWVWVDWVEELDNVHDRGTGRPAGGGYVSTHS